MPLVTPASKMWDMPLDGKTTEGRMPRWSGNVLYHLFNFIGRVFFRYEVKNVEILRSFKNKSGVVLISDHTSFADVVFIYLSTRKEQWVRFMGKSDLYTKLGGFMGQVLTRVGSFPVKRNEADLKAVKRAAKMLRDFEIVGIMPEGTRRGKGSAKLEIHSGASLIAKMGKAVILPVGVCNVEKIKEKGKMLKFPRVTIVYGEPILLSDFDFLAKEDRLDACTWYSLREAIALHYHKKPREVDMPGMFDGCRDFTDLFSKVDIAKRSPQECIDLLHPSEAGTRISGDEGN